MSKMFTQTNFFLKIMELVIAVHVFHEKIISFYTRSFLFVMTQRSGHIVGDVNS